MLPFRNHLPPSLVGMTRLLHRPFLLPTSGLVPSRDWCNSSTPRLFGVNSSFWASLKLHTRDLRTAVPSPF